MNCLINAYMRKMMIKFTKFLFLLLFIMTCTEDDKNSNFEMIRHNSEILKNLSNNLFEDYLTSFIDTSDSKLTISEYIIHSVDTPVLFDDSLLINGICLPEISKEEFDSGKPMIVRVKYSVKPKENSSYWIAGNGKLNSVNGWINNKSEYFWIKKLGGKSIIECVGTGL
ncbi:hypothetical protein H8E88_12445 [candidate division KSB1 bacterium]|nr:hypothetical protein [candidate division KSB1 bacterium]